MALPLVYFTRRRGAIPTKVLVHRLAIVAFILSMFISANACRAFARSYNRAPSEAVIRQRIVESQEGIQSLEIVYFADNVLDDQKGSAESSSRIRCSLKTKRPMLLFHDGSKETIHVPWSDSLSRQRAYLDSGQFVLEWPVNRVYFTGEWEPSGGLPGSLQGEMFFIATGIWPFDDCHAPTPFGHEHSLKEVAGSEDFNVAPDLEKVGAHNCVIMKRQDGSDILWLDVERGYVLVKREIRSSRFDAKVAVFLADEFREDAENIWIPRRLEHRYFKYNSPIEGERSCTVKHAKTIVTKVAVNCVDDSEFTFRRRPGSLHYSADDLSAPPVEAIRGSQAHLDALAGWINRTSEGDRMNGPGYTSILFISIAAGLIIKAIVANKSLRWYVGSNWWGRNG